MKILLLSFLFLLLLIPQQLFGQEKNEIFITISYAMEDVIFDGKWSSWPEWKRSSLDSFGGDQIKLRTAHQGNFVYVMLDVLIDRTIDEYSDKAIICFDTDNNKSVISDVNDYCFVAELGNENGLILRGSDVSGKNYFEEISHVSGFIGIGNSSDKSDRYLKTPHSSYEFRIPTDLIGRSSVYGYYVGVYDASSNKTYHWPEGTTDKNVEQIPSPSKWGSMISPDRSLPEFQWPLLILLPILTMVILVTRVRLNAGLINH